MFAKLASGLKVTAITLLFFAPLVAAQWNVSLDQWMRENHSWQALPAAEVSAANSVDSPAPDLSQIDDQTWEQAR